MEYRKIEKLGETVSLLGYGGMRLPLTPDGEVDMALSERLIARAMEGGINYYDTAFPYIDGKSEKALGRLLSQYKRDSYKIATKLAPWLVNSVADAEAMFEEQLRRLKTDYIDFYLLHSLDAGRWDALQKNGVLEYADRLRAEGRIRHLGFSFHDPYESFERIIKGHSFDFCQIQYNYMDRHVQAGDRGYELAAAMDIPVVVMEPNKGGSLVRLPEQCMDILKEYGYTGSPASLALRWVTSHHNVKVALSGMSSMEQLEDNLATFSDYSDLSERELEMVDRLAEVYNSLSFNGCTGCRYCMPCPNGVSIPEVFYRRNDFSKFKSSGAVDELTSAYFIQVKAPNRADQCLKCGLCETKCPQHLPIMRDLERAAADFAPYHKADYDD